MTTKVTVDAHAGWPVKVTPVGMVNGQWTEQTSTAVPANTTQEFHVHSQQKLTIEEMPRG